MKIAVTSMGGSLDAQMSERFGRCPWFIIFDSDTGKFEAVSNLGEQMQSGAGPKAAELIASKNSEVIITGNVGDKAAGMIQKAGMKTVEGYSEKMTVRDALEKYLAKKI